MAFSLPSTNAKLGLSYTNSCKYTVGVKGYPAQTQKYCKGYPAYNVQNKIEIKTIAKGYPAQNVRYKIEIKTIAKGYPAQNVRRKIEIKTIAKGYPAQNVRHKIELKTIGKCFPAQTLLINTILDYFHKFHVISWDFM